MRLLLHHGRAGAFLRGALFLLVCLSAGIISPSAYAYRVELDAPAPLKDLLTEHLDLIRYSNRDDINADQFDLMIATVAEQVARLASTEGFFSTKTKVKTDRNGGATVVRIVVDAGPRTHVSKVDIDVTGPAALQSPNQTERVHQRWSLKAGEPFRQQDWSAAKQDGLQVLQQYRYPAAQIAGSEAHVYADRAEAALAVDYDSGPFFTFGETRVSGASRYPENIVRNVSPLAAGEEYSAERLLEFQRQILRTPYYSNVVINIDSDPAHAELAPVNVRVTEFPTQRIRGGAGYTTDTGAHLNGLYSYNNLFGRAWVLDAQTRLEQRRQSGSLQLTLPPGRGGFVDNMHASFDRTTLEGIELRTRRAGVRRAHVTDKLDTAYTIEYYRDRLDQLNGAAPPPDTVVQPGSHQALVAGIDKTWRRVNDMVFPRKGRVISIEAGAAVKGLLTDQSFVRLYGQLHEYLPVGKRDLVILRTELGVVLSKGGNRKIPASLLFRAGGTDSVRGYTFQSIGNERNDTVYPTRFLATGSAEYQHWRSERWGGAVFYDVGMAANRWNGKSLFHAVGAGVRWRSPVGNVRFDLAYGFQRKQIRPHLSLGVAF